MAWNSSRPVPWRRLVREWLIYIAIASVAFLIILRDQLTLGLFAGLLASGPMYVLFGAVLAKFGYQRKTFKDLRQDRERGTAARARSTAVAPQTITRNRPAPTKRTSTGPSQHRKGNKPRRR